MSRFPVSAEPRLQFAVVPLDLLCDADLDPYDRAVYAALDSFRNGQTGLCCPSVNTLAARAGCSRDKTLDSLANLERLGWIMVEPRHRRSSLYILPWREALDKATGTFRRRSVAVSHYSGGCQPPQNRFAVAVSHSNHLNSENHTNSTSLGGPYRPKREEAEAIGKDLTPAGAAFQARLRSRQGART